MKIVNQATNIIIIIIMSATNNNLNIRVIHFSSLDLNNHKDNNTVHEDEYLVLFDL